MSGGYCYCYFEALCLDWITRHLARRMCVSSSFDLELTDDRQQESHCWAYIQDLVWCAVPQSLTKYCRNTDNEGTFQKMTLLEQSLSPNFILGNSPITFLYVSLKN
jgi:hypothetical protein